MRVIFSADVMVSTVEKTARRVHVNQPPARMEAPALWRVTQPSVSVVMVMAGLDVRRWWIHVCLRVTVQHIACAVKIAKGQPYVYVTKVRRSVMNKCFLFTYYVDITCIYMEDISILDVFTIRIAMSIYGNSSFM